MRSLIALFVFILFSSVVSAKTVSAWTDADWAHKLTLLFVEGQEVEDPENKDAFGLELDTEVPALPDFDFDLLPSFFHARDFIEPEDERRSLPLYLKFEVLRL